MKWLELKGEITSTESEILHVREKKCLQLKILYVTRNKMNQFQILHVREIIFLELKILLERLNKMDRIVNTSCKKNEKGSNENISIKVK